MKVQRVIIAPDRDGVQALYLNGKLETQGDEYHDDIGAYIDGFIDGLQEACEFDLEVWEWPMTHEALTYEFEGVPATFDEIPKERLNCECPS